MALFTEAMFTTTDFDRPVGVTGDPIRAADPVTLQLSDGTSIVLFDKLTTALRLGGYMRQNKQWQVAMSEDVTVVSANGGIKLLALENTLQNQKLLTSFVPVYTGDQLLFVHRSMSSVLSLTEALRSVGFCVKSPLPFANNLDLRLGLTGIQVIDWNYQASPADSQSGSLLADGSPLVFDYTA
jgi:hypothetical protein